MKKIISKIFDKFRKHKKSHQPQKLVLRCVNCKHTDKGFDEVPCCYCDKNSEWEKKNDA